MIMESSDLPVYHFVFYLEVVRLSLRVVQEQCLKVQDGLKYFMNNNILIQNGNLFSFCNKL